MKSLLNTFPSSDNHPYYIVSHPYTRVSAGIRSLHLLCHHLNLNGFPAYIIFIGKENNSTGSSIEPDFLTPILTQQAARYHFESGKKPIMVYPEIVSGNPYASPCVVRYVLNFPGLLGGDRVYGKDELCWGYSKTLAAETSCPENVLFIPASNTNIFYPPKNQITRAGSCFYASKYKREHKGEIFDVTRTSVEITSRMPNSQSPQEIAELFRRSELFYTYENSALALEATLCGCPAVFLPNQHLKSIIASEELGNDGFAWGDSPEEISRAKATVNMATKNYEKAVDGFQKNLLKFITLTQDYAAEKKYSHQQYLELCNHIPASQNTTWISGEIGIKERSYAPLLKKLPWPLEKKLGALLCSLGLMHDGEFLWNRATRRSKNKAQ